MTRTITRKKHTGEAGNGGQFGTTARGEAEVSFAPQGFVPDTPVTISDRLLEQYGVPYDSRLSYDVEKAWIRRFGDGTPRARTDEDAAILSGQLPPWRVLADEEQVSEADERTAQYAQERSQIEEQVQGTVAFYKQTDQMLVDLEVRQRREKYATAAFVVSQILISTLPHPHRRRAQTAYTAYAAAKAMMSRRRGADEGSVEQQAALIVAQQNEAQAEADALSAHLDRLRADAEGAQWRAGLPPYAQRLAQAPDAQRWTDACAGFDPDDVHHFASELEVEIE